MSDPRTIATLRKNNSEEIRFRVAEHDGHTLVELRVFSASRRNSSEPQPTRAGICVLRERLPELIQALQVAQREAAR